MASHRGGADSEVGYPAGGGQKRAKREPEIAMMENFGRKNPHRTLLVRKGPEDLCNEGVAGKKNAGTHNAKK